MRTQFKTKCTLYIVVEMARSKENFIQTDQLLVYRCNK